MGVDRSTYYRLKAEVDRWGLEALNVRERRWPRMPTRSVRTSSSGSSRSASRTPATGPGGSRPSWPGRMGRPAHLTARRLAVRVRVGLNTRAKRLALIARHRDPYQRRPDLPPPARHIDATKPGQKVQLDCFYVGRLSGTKGTAWQYTAIDVASAYTWAELRSTERNPRARHTRELLHRVAAELAAAGWKLQEVITDNGPSSGPRSSATPSPRSAPANGSSAPCDRTATAASNACR
jgi:hypothetical protein